MTLAFAAALAVVCARAEAAVYTLENVVQPSGVDVPPAPTATLIISDAAVARGSFHLSAVPFSGLSGDVSDYTSFTLDRYTADLGRLRFNEYALTLDLTFASDGSVATAGIYYLTQTPELTLNGPGNALVGKIAPSDTPYCLTAGNDCRILSAALVRTDVPEPMSLALLLAPAVGITARRRNVRPAPATRTT